MGDRRRNVVYVVAQSAVSGLHFGAQAGRRGAVVTGAHRHMGHSPILGAIDRLTSQHRITTRQHATFVCLVNERVKYRSGDRLFREVNEELGASAAKAI